MSKSKKTRKQAVIVPVGDAGNDGGEFRADKTVRDQMLDGGGFPDRTGFAALSALLA